MSAKLGELHIVSVDQKVCSLLAYGQTLLVLDSDFPWLLEQIEFSSAEKQNLWAACIMSTLRPDHLAEWLDVFLEVRSRIQVLKEKYSTYWEFDSELARDMKENHLRRMRWERENSYSPPNPAIAEEIEKSLQKIENDEPAEWINLTYFLSIDSVSGELRDWPSSIVDTPGWKSANEKQREQIKKAAKTFILHYVPKSDDWFGKGSYSLKTNLSIFLAIRCIAETREIADTIPDNIWARFVPYMIDCPAFNDRETRCLLFNQAYQKAPELTKTYFSRLIDSENEA